MFLRNIVCKRSLAPLAVMLFFGMGGPAAGSKKEEELEAAMRPPMPVDVEAAVYLGESIEIPLKVRGRVVEPLKILIRIEPRHGTLGKIQLLPRGRGGIVRYTASGNAKGTRDSFSFAAQSLDSPVSGPGQVVISLKQRPARLEYERDIDFGEVALGEDALRTVRVRNSGAADAILEPRGTGPWNVEREGQLTLKGGQETEIRLRFRPDSTGDFRERIRMAADQTEFLVVHGSSFTPLTWDSRGLVFSSANRSTGRAAAVLKNRSASKRTVHFAWPDFLKAPAEVTIEAGGEAVFEAELHANPEFAHAGTVELRSAGFTGTLPLAIEPAPAKVVLEPAQILELPEMAAGETAQGKLILKNTGGLEARVRLVAEGGLDLDPEAAGLVLEPGAQRQIGVRKPLEKSGRFTHRIRLECDSQNHGELKVVSSARAARPIEQLLAIPPAVDMEKTSNLPPIADFTGARMEEDSVELEWRRPAPEAVAYLIEERVLGRGDRIQSWVPAEGVQCELTMEGGKALFHRLRPGFPMAVRIRALDAEGRPGAPSQTIVLELPAPRGGSGWIWFLVAIAGLAIYAGARLFRGRLGRR